MEPLSEQSITRLRKLGGDAFLGKMIDLFVTYATEKIKEATEAFERKDYAAAGKAAHALKSSAGNVGALRVGQLATAIEQQAGAGEGPELADSIAELVVAFQEVRPLLEARKREAGSD